MVTCFEGRILLWSRYILLPESHAQIYEHFKINPVNHKCGIINLFRIKIVTCFEGHILLWSRDIMNISQCYIVIMHLSTIILLF